MSDGSAIEWTDATWNPVRGCTKVSPGCKHCLAPDTPVLMADMSWRAIAELTSGDEVVGFTESPTLGANRVYELARVVHIWRTRADAVEIAAGSRTIIASSDHLFLAHARPYWRPAERLSLKTGLVDIGVPAWCPDVASESYLSGYLAGVVAGDGTFRIDGSGRRGTKQSYLRVAVMTSDRPILDRLAAGLIMNGCEEIHIRSFDSGRGSDAAPMSKIETRRRQNLLAIEKACVERDDRAWKAGFLAGFFDTDGCYSSGNLRFSQTKANRYLDVSQRYIHDLGFASQREDFRSARGRSERIVGTVEDKARFLATISPALARKTHDIFGRRFPSKRSVRVEGVRRIGVRELVDIQTTSGTFIAAGFATHNCYAEAFSERFRGVRGHPFEQGFDLRVVPEKLEEPLGWRRSRRIFVNSMSDLFQDDVPASYIARVGRVMEAADWHVFQVLTKRHGRMRELLSGELSWLAGLANIWFGVSVENKRHGLPRIEALRRTPAAVRFLSIEPLLEDLGPLDLRGIDWVIVGGESGPRARPMREEWVLSIRDQCQRQRVAFFFKQWGGVRKHETGRELRGRTYDAFPGARASAR